MQKLLSIIWLSLLINTVKAQSVNIYTTNASPINQLCPNFVFDSLLNYKKDKVAMADWKGRHVIIDFWGTFCLPCIADIPKLENFQKRFGDSLQVLMVATDGFGKASQFYDTRKKANKFMVLPCAVNKEAHDYFKVKVVSTYVWIDDRGYVKAITDYSQLTEKNMADFVGNKDIHLREIEASAFADYKNKRYLVTIASEMDSSNVVFNSSFTKYLKGVTSSYKYPPKGVGTTVHATNAHVCNLYMIAFGDSTGAVPYSRMVIESAHPGKYLMPKDADYQVWKIDNTFCYELTVPANRQNDILKIMQDDLKRMFGANVYMENRMQKCLVLTSDKNVHISADKSSAPKIAYNSVGCTLINQPFARFFDKIRHYNQDKILLDETGITGNVSVTLQAPMNDVNALNEALKTYGLSLEYKDREIKMLVIKDPVK